MKDKRRWGVRSAGKGSKGGRWYAWAWIGTASPRHHLLVRHLKTGKLAFHYCYVPEGQLLTKTRMIGAALLRDRTDSQAPRPSAQTSPRHQARLRWFHQRARLNRDYALVS